MLQWIADNAAVILGVLFGMSEALGEISYFKNSSVFGVVVSTIKKLKDAFTPKQQ